MAALINRPMYEHFAARHLAVKGPGAMTTLEEGVMGVLPMDMSSDPAYWFIQGIRVFSKRVSKTGSGSNIAKVGLSIEDAASTVLATILGVFIFDPASPFFIDAYRVARTSFSSDPGVYGVSTDTRTPEAQPSDAVCISAVDTATPGTLWGRFQVDDWHQISPTIPMIVKPTEAIYFTNPTTGNDLELTIVWAEIPAYKAEL
jgi:hypothetical protein